MSILDIKGMARPLCIRHLVWLGMLRSPNPHDAFCCTLAIVGNDVLFWEKKSQLGSQKKRG